MDDLSTIFYIIVAIIYVIYSAIKRGKPKDLPQSGPEAPTPDEFGDVTQVPPPGKTQRRPTFEDLLREFTQPPAPEAETEVAKDPDQPEPFFQPEQPYFEEKKATSIYDEYQNVEIGDDDILRRPSVFKAQDQDEEIAASKLGAEIRDMLKNPDGLKKAILLNEIIRPKYF